MTFFKLVAATALCALVGCGSGSELSSLRTDPAAEETLAASRTIFANRTFVTHSLHGTQIEFHDSAGKSFLWYPGNSRAVPALWQVRPYAGSGYEICWQYPSNSRNGLTGAKGGRWECTPSFAFTSKLKEVAEGDPFGLASGQVPYRLPKGKFTTQQLLKQAGKPAASAQVIYSK